MSSRPRWHLWAIDEATKCAMIADTDAEIDVRGLHEGGRRLVEQIARRKNHSARHVVGLRYEAHPPGVTPPGCRVLG
jgi:hypothetical protein